MPKLDKRGIPPQPPPPTLNRVTLGERLAGRHNALNALRLAFALFVVISHTWPLSGQGHDLAVGGQSLGGWGVAGFFAISGYLIPASRLRQSASAYTTRRALRILPGLWVCLAVTAFAIAPIAAAATRTTYDLPGAVGYVLNNATTLIRQTTIGDILDGRPVLDWNGSLWSLFYEVCCYLIAGALLSIPALRKRQLWVAASLLLFATLGNQVIYLWLLGFFAAGWVLGAVRDHIRPSWALTVGAGLALMAAEAFLPAATAMPLALTVLSLGALLPGRWLVTNDISYGTYLYGFPVQQALALAGVPALGLYPYLALSVAGALTFGAASWFLVERHMLPRRSPAPVELADDCAMGRSCDADAHAFLDLARPRRALG